MKKSIVRECKKLFISISLAVITILAPVQTSASADGSSADKIIYGSDVKFTVDVTNCTEGNRDGKITVTIIDPEEDSDYLVSFDEKRGKLYEIKKDKLTLKNARQGTRCISVTKKGDNSSVSNFVTVSVDCETDTYPVIISAESVGEKIYKDGSIKLYINNYDSSKKYEYSTNGGTKWRKMSGSSIRITQCKGKTYNIVVREKGKNNRASAVLNVHVKEATAEKNKVYIPVEMIMQNPELPTGCEITSLTMLLNYIGFDADKLDLSDNYLPKGEYRASDYNEVFVGNPRSTFAYGCFSKAIVNAAEKYLEKYDKEDEFDVINITGCSPKSLYAAVEQGDPVVVWTSIDMKDVKAGRSWVVKETGKTVTWPANEHCLLLVGYNTDKNLVYVNDPLKEVTAYDMQLFEKSFYQLDQNAVIIVKNPAV